MGRVLVAGAALVVVAALSAGCATSAQGTPAQPVAPTVPPSPSVSGLPLGRSAQADNGQVQATVFAYQQPAAPAGPDGGAWGAADVQVCVAGTAIFDVSISRGPWQVQTRDGRTVPATLTVDPALPRPAYPADHRRLHVGDCVRGWIGFGIPPDAAAAAVQYAPTGSSPVTWAVR